MNIENYLHANLSNIQMFLNTIFLKESKLFGTESIDGNLFLIFFIGFTSKQEFSMNNMKRKK